jgi:hypothetical protein
MIESALGPDRARELRLRGKEMDTGAALLFALRDDSEEEKTNA